MPSKRTAQIFVNGVAAAIFTEEENGYSLTYDENYKGPPISLTLPQQKEIYYFSSFPAFFDGLLPEGPQLEALLKQAKLDRNDLLGQLIQVGADCVGAVSIKGIRS